MQHSRRAPQFVKKRGLPVGAIRAHPERFGADGRLHHTLVYRPLHEGSHSVGLVGATLLSLALLAAVPRRGVSIG